MGTEGDMVGQRSAQPTPVKPASPPPEARRFQGALQTGARQIGNKADGDFAG